MEISEIRLDRIVTNVWGVLIEFDVEDLNQILGIANTSFKIYTCRKTLLFTDFVHWHAVRNIRRRRDISDDTCSLPFCAQLLPLQIRILHTIL